MKAKIIKNLLALALIVLLFSLVDLKMLGEAFSHLTVASASMLLLVSVLLIYISAVKWGLFLDHFRNHTPVLRLFNLYLVGYFVNLIMPSYLGGDVVRSWYAGKKQSQHDALAATILERYTGLVAMVLLAFTFMWFVENVTWQIELFVVLVMAGVVFITVVALSKGLLDACEKRVVSRAPSFEGVFTHLRKVQDAFFLAREDKGLFVRALLLSFLYHSFTVVNTLAAAYAVGWYNAPALDLFVVLPLILLVGALPVAPSGLGIQEGAFFYFLAQVGATPEQALGVGLVLRAKSYVLALAGGLVWLSIRGKKFTPQQSS